MLRYMTSPWPWWEAGLLAGGIGLLVQPTSAWAGFVGGIAFAMIAFALSRGHAIVAKEQVLRLVALDVDVTSPEFLVPFDDFCRREGIVEGTERWGYSLDAWHAAMAFQYGMRYEACSGHPGAVAAVDEGGAP